MPIAPIRSLGLALAIFFAPITAAAANDALELNCRHAAQARSQNSDTPAKIRFVNESSEVRTIIWIDFEGNSKEYARLKPGEELTQPTYLTHPWIVGDADGGCILLYMPEPGTSTARIPY